MLSKESEQSSQALHSDRPCKTSGKMQQIDVSMSQNLRSDDSPRRLCKDNPLQDLQMLFCWASIGSIGLDHAQQGLCPTIISCPGLALYPAEPSQKHKASSDSVALTLSNRAYWNFYDVAARPTALLWYPGRSTKRVCAAFKAIHIRSTSSAQAAMMNMHVCGTAAPCPGPS